MSYSKTEQNELKILLERVAGNKSHKYAAPTYKDSADLNEIKKIVQAELSAGNEDDKDTLSYSIEILRYLAGSFESMNKVAYSVELYKQLLILEVRGILKFSIEKNNLKEDFYSAVRARNYYGKDNCSDLIEIVSSVLKSSETEKVINEVISNYPHFKRDAVELSEKYLSVIDEVERKIEETRKTDLCHEYWSLKKLYLSDFGINWHSPSELNPNTIFD